MKIKFNTDELLPVIGNCAAIVNSKNSLPILSNILVESNDLQNDIVVTTSDGETWLSCKANVIESDKNVRFCVNANDIYKALSNLKGKVVEFDINEQKHIVTCKHDTGRFSLPIETCENFPKATIIASDEENGVTTKIFKSCDILNAVKKTCFAISSDELRPVMNGIHFDFFKDCMVSVASDGHKLVKFKNMDITMGDGVDNEPINGFTLPQKPSMLLANILSGMEGENVKLVFDEHVVVINNKDFKLTTRLIEGNYPNYDRVIPKDNNINVKVRKNDIINALKRVMPMSNQTSELISLKFTKRLLNIEAVDFDFSKSANESVSCDNDFEMTIGFKGSMLLSVLQNIDGEDLNIFLKDPSKAAIFCPTTKNGNTEYTSLLMPMLVQYV